MNVESEIKILKDADQVKKPTAFICCPKIDLNGKTAGTLWGLCCLIFGLIWLAGSWLAFLWPLALVGAGIFYISQANHSKT